MSILPTIRRNIFRPWTSRCRRPCQLDFQLAEWSGGLRHLAALGREKIRVDLVRTVTSRPNLMTRSYSNVSIWEGRSVSWASASTTNQKY
jgi:hypothetical protein